MKKISLITLLLVLTTTQSLFLMDFAEQELEKRCQYINSVIQESNEQISSFYTLKDERLELANNLYTLWSDFKSQFDQGDTPLPILFDQIQEIKTQFIELKKKLTQSLDIQKEIKNNSSIMQRTITSPIESIPNKKVELISNKKEHNKTIQKLIQQTNYFQKKTISNEKKLQKIQNVIENIEEVESAIEIALKKTAENIALIKKSIITSILLCIIIAISRYIYKNHHGDVSLLFNQA